MVVEVSLSCIDAGNCYVKLDILVSRIEALGGKILGIDDTAGLESGIDQLGRVGREVIKVNKLIIYGGL